MARKTVLGYLDDYTARGSQTAVAHRRGLRLVRWSYGRIAAAAHNLARELEERGVKKGDRALLCGENCAEWVAAFWGCLLRGVIVVPLDAQSEPAFVARVQEQVEAKVLLYASVNPCSFKLNIPAINLLEPEALAARHPRAAASRTEIDEDDTVEIIFTSGTTAEPKGVRLSHRNLLANLGPLEEEIQKYLRWERLVHPVRFLSLLPLSHVFGQFMGIFLPQLLGGEVFFQEALNPSEIISTVKRQRVNVLAVVPRLLEALREKIEADYRSSGRPDQFRRAFKQAEGWHFLRRWWAFRGVHKRLGWRCWAFISGGATLDAETEKFWQRLGFAVIQGYGMTETASLISVNHPFKMSRGSIGRVLPGHEVKLDESGEILVRGENVAAGYWNTDGGLRAGDEGWFRTGDVGELDTEGNLYFKGRKKDVIVTAAGMNIYPEDIEAALNRQQEVRASAVVALDGPRGPEPLAVLILRDKDEDAAGVVQRANALLAQHQQVRRWLIWPEKDFPRTPTQKVRKSLIAEWARAAVSDQLPQVEAASALASLITRVSGETLVNLHPQANLTTDLKLDSLGRVELLSALEDEYQIEIDEGALTTATTLGDIEKIIQGGAPENALQYPETKWSQRFPATWIRSLVYNLLLLPLTRLMAPLRVEGTEHLRELKGPLLFVANHVSMVDHGLILSALPGRFRSRLAIAMDGEILRDYRYPPQSLGWFQRLRWRVQYALIVALFNVFPLPHRSGFRRSFAFAGEALDRGYHLLVFPEGKRTEDGRMNPFMKGTGLLVEQLDVSVVPVRIDGLFELKQARRHLARRGELCIRFGPAVKYGPQEEAARITADLERRVAAL
ncbi:MAG TPA: AMP-binding protein [Pyrinomonadaceae bacterium]|jgi:long-chain acyl-CoA synthetase